MRCPRCGSESITRYRSPRTLADMELRRHRCTPCGLVFLSVQTVVDDPSLVLELLEAFEGTAD